MIGWGDIYKVVGAILPLYSAVGLGYGAVRWWRVLSAEQCDAINRLVSLFTIPFFTFQFTFHVDPFAVNGHFLAADAVSKLVIVLALAAWAKLCPASSKENHTWAITAFALCTLTNSLVTGLPMLTAMYGPLAEALVVQVSVVQSIIWMPLLLLALEVRRARDSSGDAISPESRAKDGADHLESADMMQPRPPSFLQLMKTVWLKLALNPNSYASFLGIAWAFVANRWGIEMPSIVEGSVLVMSRAGAGTAMFNLGLFMALQEKVVACGARLTALGMVLRFVAGPAAMAVGALVVRLHGDVLRVAIIQAALPQSIASFIVARAYGLHAEVLSTVVIFGMLIAMPILVAYYVLLGFI